MWSLQTPFPHTLVHKGSHDHNHTEAGRNPPGKSPKRSCQQLQAKHEDQTLLDSTFSTIPLHPNPIPATYYHRIGLQNDQHSAVTMKSSSRITCQSNFALNSFSAVCSYYGLLAQRYCGHHQSWQALYEDCFRKQYAFVHRLETNKLRNVARFTLYSPSPFPSLHLLQASPWCSALVVSAV